MSVLPGHEVLHAAGDGPGLPREVGLLVDQHLKHGGSKPGIFFSTPTGLIFLVHSFYSDIIHFLTIGSVVFSTLGSPFDDNKSL